MREGGSVFSRVSGHLKWHIPPAHHTHVSYILELTYLRCVCAGKQASAYTQASRDRGKGTYMKLTRCVDGEGAADSHMFFFLRRTNTNKPEISEHVYTRVPELRTHTHTHTRHELR